MIMPLPDWLKPPTVMPIAEVPWWLEHGRVVEGIQVRTRHKSQLSLLQNAEDPFPNSEKNDPSSRKQEDYEKVLEGYMAVIESEKTDFLEYRASIGHKVHLNVAPENVQAVSTYLKENRYAHKYLSGGEVEDGKIFTIYFGSLKMAKKWATQLAQDLGGKLLRPKARSEIEHAPNISGRFVGNQIEFTQYPLGGIRGISSLKELVNGDLWTSRTPQEEAKHAARVFDRSYERLAELYGKYFYGE